MASTTTTAIDNQLTSSSWQTRVALTVEEYDRTFNGLVSQGYRLDYVSGYSINDKLHLAVIWSKRASAPWIAKYGMSADEFQTSFDRLSNEGFRLALVNGYTVRGKSEFVAIWDQSQLPTDQVAKHDMEATQYEITCNALRERGYRLRHISGYTLGNETRYAAIWEAQKDGIEWIAHYKMDSEDYETRHASLIRSGYHLVDVSGYEVANVDYYAAIWERSTASNIIASHRLTFDQYHGEYINNIYQGYVPTVVAGYTLDDSDKYATIWENRVMSRVDLSLIDNKIKDYMNANTVPGLSLAIVKDLRLVFAKGFGFADKAAQIKVNPDHLFRVGSISKLFTSIAIMKLIEDGRLCITDRVFGPGAILGTTYGLAVFQHQVHEITVQNLLEHTSGWAAVDVEPIDKLNSLDQSQIITWVLERIAPANLPGVVYDYLNFGYLVLGRVIEMVTGQRYEAYVKEILSPFCVNTIQIGADKSAQISGEVKYYPTSDSYDYNMSRLDSFGGWVATTTDVAKIMSGINQHSIENRILRPDTVKEMFTPSSANPEYAKGWIIKPNYRGHNGALCGSGSFYAQKLTGGYSFAVFCNSRPSYDLFCYQLRDIVDSICTTVTNWPKYNLF